MEDSEYVLLKHTRCAGRTINLVATSAADKALKDSPSYRKMYWTALGKATELWNKQARSSQASDTIKAEIGMLLTVPTITRWNSVYGRVSHLANIFQDREKLHGLHWACNILGVPSFLSSE